MRSENIKIIATFMLVMGSVLFVCPVLGNLAGFEELSREQQEQTAMEHAVRTSQGCEQWFGFWWCP